MDIVERLRIQQKVGIFELPDEHEFVGWEEAANEIERLRELNENKGQTCAIYWNEIQNLRKKLGLETPWFGDVEWWKKAALKENADG